MIKREIEKKIEKFLQSKDKKIFFIWGPRRSGKTTIIKEIGRKYGIRVNNFDFIEDRELFTQSRIALNRLAKTSKIILIDEIQNYPQATTSLKLLHDEYNVKIIATGSSELRQTTNDFDTLAGRYSENYCLPLNIKEILTLRKPIELDKNNILKEELAELLINGAYPEVYTSTNSENVKQDLLSNIINTYVLKDVINIYNLKDLKLAKDILTKLALQIGSEVSLREIANSLQANVSTVSNYIEIFVKNYILISLPSFKTNQRRAVSENKKYYFLDLGLRNSLIRDFRELKLRQDSGAVFENFVISEIEKIRRYVDYNFNMYFYREYHGKEVDLVLEDYKKRYKVFEIKISKDLSDIDKVFPLKHSLNVINVGNFYEQIEKLYKNNFR